MMRFVAIIALACCLAVPAHAQDQNSPKALSAARELSAIMTGDTMTQITDAMTAQIWPTIERALGSKVEGYSGEAWLQGVTALARRLSFGQDCSSASL